MDLKTETIEEPRTRSGFWGKLIDRYGSITGKLSGAVVDQALFGGSNFILNVLLARWMEPSQYGAFVVAYSWFLLPQNFYDALLIEPMSIFGSGRYFKKLRYYLGYIYYGHMGIGLVGALVLAIGAIFSHVVDSALMGTALLGVAVATPMMLSRWLTRQPLYVMTQPHHSALGGAIYLVLSTASIWVLYQLDILDPFTAILANGLANLASSIFLTLRFIKPVLRLKKDEDLAPRKLIREHLGYARWSILSRGLSWISINIYYVMLPVIVGLGGSAALRALMNFSMPMSMAIAAVLTLLLPMFVRAYENEGKASLNGKIRMALGLMVGGSLVYLVAVVLFGGLAASQLYRGQFDEFVTLPVLVTLGLIPVTTSFNIVMDAALRSMGHIKLAFISQIASAVLALTAGLLLMSTLGLLGVTLSMNLTALVTVAIQWSIYRRLQ
ncbi:MAG: hypothetical protein ACOCZH_00965 [Phototrophicaceae bacterium]